MLLGCLGPGVHIVTHCEAEIGNEISTLHIMIHWSENIEKKENPILDLSHSKWNEKDALRTIF